MAPQVTLEGDVAPTLWAKKEEQRVFCWAAALPPPNKTPPLFPLFWDGAPSDLWATVFCSATGSKVPTVSGRYGILSMERAGEMTMPRKVEILRVSREYDGFYKLDRAVLRHERYDGTMSEPITRLNVVRPDAVGVLLYNREQDTVVLVEQFRYSAYVNDGPGWILEIVAGLLDKGRTDAVSVARAELLEEAGYQVKDLEYLTTFYLSPGGSSERLHLYLGYVSRGDRVGAGGGAAGEQEDIRVVELPLTEALEMVQRGEICDAKTIIALLWLAFWKKYL